MFLHSNTNAQFLKKLKKKLTDKIEKKIENKIDKETDKVIDTLLDGKKKNDYLPISEIPKFTLGEATLKLSNYGFEYNANDVTISVYGKFTTTNLSNAAKTYNSDKIIAPVDAYPPDYALAYNEGGFLNPKNGQIIIHYADSTKLVYSLKGTWRTYDDKVKQVEASFVNMNVKEIKQVGEKQDNFNSKSNKKIPSNTTNQNYSSPITVSTTVNIPDTFSFTSSIELEITTDENEKVSMEVLLGEYPDIYAMSYADQQMDGSSVFNVFTPKSVTTFMNIPGMKIKKSISQQEVYKMSFNKNITEDEGEMTKTGAIKTILGYSCEEYRYSNNGGYVSVWASKTFPIQNKKVSMLGMGKDGFPYGFVMEMDIKSGKDNGNIKVVKYNPNKSLIIKTNEYKSF